MFNGGKIPSLDSDISRSAAAQKTFDKGKNKFGLKDKKGMAPEGIHFEDLQTAWHRQCPDKSTETVKLHGHGSDIQNSTQSIGNGSPNRPEKGIINNVQGRHPDLDNPFLAGEIVTVVILRFFLSNFFRLLDFSTGYALE